MIDFDIVHVYKRLNRKTQPTLIGPITGYDFDKY